MGGGALNKQCTIFPRILIQQNLAEHDGNDAAWISYKS